jgi:hypothetical protein
VVVVQDSLPGGAVVPTRTHRLQVQHRLTRSL